MTQFATLPLVRIAPSLTNPRKTFNAAKLQELADSIAASGVHQAVLVRPITSARLMDTEREVQYELVAGERRYRASQLAGVDTIPAMIRVLTDDQVLEIQLVENLQRDDLSALEEAEGYQALMQHSNISADDVGVKIGKSRAYVYGRLKLLDLSQEVKQAMRDGALDFSRALLIARIPDSALQAKALFFAAEPNFQGEVPSVRTFTTWLQANVMLRLDKAVFKITDTRLVQAAGSCTACPKRTGANPDLFVDASSADLCIDPACYHDKEAAHRAALVALAARKGMQFIEGKEAQELFYHQYTDKMKGYSPLSQVREDCIKDGQTGLTLRELLGDDAPAPVLIENPYTKALIEAVPDDETEGVLTAKGLRRADDDEDSDDAQGKPRGMASWNAKALQERLKNIKARVDSATAIETNKNTLAATRAAVRATNDVSAKLLIGPTMLRAFLTSALDNQPSNFMADALGYTFAKGEDETDALAMHIRATDHANLCRAAAIVFMELEEDWTYGEMTMPVREFLCEDMQINTQAIAKSAAKEVLDRFADELKEVEALIKAKTEPATDTKKRDLPHSPLAQPMTGGGDAKAGAKSQPKPGAARKTKLSAEEAKSGIAAAMQAEDRAGTAPPETTKVSKAVAVTYRGPNGETWSGRGLKPRWVTVHIAQGGTLEQLSVNQLTLPLASAPRTSTLSNFAKGTEVRITENDDKLRFKHSKYAGKTGKVTGFDVGGKEIDVKIGREMRCFEPGELEAV